MRKLFYSICFFTITASSLFSHDIPEPHAIIDIPMRDGFKLATDLYFPGENPKEYPCILIRSPAGRKHPISMQYIPLVQYGYVIAIQETRSSVDVEGKTFPYFSDGWGSKQDGYDTVEWLAKSDYSNGKIGTVGVSALGIMQLMLAPTNPPSLKCQHIGTACASLYHHALYPGGQTLKNQIEGWLGLYAKDVGVINYVTSRQFYNEFWQQFNTTTVSDRVNVPAIHYGGWYDTFIQGTIDAFLARQENGGDGAKGNQKLIIGPWTHMWPHVTTLGDFDIPKPGQSAPFDFSPVPWFDYYLKNKKNGIDEIPAVTYYVMGPFDGSDSSGNVWRYSEVWPPPMKETKLYLSPAKTLVDSVVSVENSSFSYFYDPDNPVPTLGGRNLFLESGPKDQSSLEKRNDVLVFTSKPLDEDLEITGKVYAKLFFSSNCPDTDVVIKLTDVYPDGKSVLISDGIFRLGVLGVENKDFDLKEPKDVIVDLWSTSFVFAKDHSIRVTISSSNYPRYEKNLNIGFLGEQLGSSRLAKNCVHVGQNFQSHIVLPVVRRGDKMVAEEQKENSDLYTTKLKN